MASRLRRWLTVEPLAAVLTRWARRLIGANNEEETEPPIELTEEEAMWPPPAGHDPGGDSAADEDQSWGPQGE